MAKKETAEQKLLKMIEATSVGTADQKVTKQHGLLGVLKTTNIFLILGTVGAFVMLGLEIKNGTELLNKDIRFTVVKGMAGASKDAATLLPATHKLAYYLSGVENRNMFHPFVKKETQNLLATSDKNKTIMQKE